MWVYIIYIEPFYPKGSDSVVERVEGLLKDYGGTLEESSNTLRLPNDPLRLRYETSEQLPKSVLTQFTCNNPGMAGYSEFEFSFRDPFVNIRF